LKSRSGVTQSHWKWQHSTDRVHEFLLACCNNYGPILYHFRDKGKFWSKIEIFLTPPAFDGPIGGLHRDIAITFGKEKSGGSARRWEKFENVMFTHFDTTHERDRHPDRQTDRQIDR